MQHNEPDHANVIAPPPLIYGVAFIVGWLIHRAFPDPVLPETLARWIGVVFGLASIPVAITAFRAMIRAQTSFDPRKPTTAIVSKGSFRYSRNPMYVSLTLLYLGVALLINSLWIVLLVVPVLVVMQRGVIAREEAYLERKFGEEYLAYKSRVRRWV
jgi:protein-S-isoprenylcysteine O-methyltransferase Ste14